jgi:FkbH-like protein
MLREQVKMVIWDLDDTFWTGTLAESGDGTGGITPVERNKNIVITLARRGIVSSICSKNDHATAEAELRRMGMWDWFVLPKIEFGPKGQNIASIIEEANLRADNVLFLDDNIMNLEEAKHYAPGIMVADPAEILEALLALPQLQGKDDKQLSRLNQYKSLEKKVYERNNSNLGNVAFLRQSDIRIAFDYDFEAQFDRVVELANRSNQLNFTKSRFETPEAQAQFRAMLGEYGSRFGAVHVADRYGDYGIVGFYAGNRIANRNDLAHFVFSCRAMNMGVEQYVYERLGKPQVKVVQPVANPIVTFERVDWINEGIAKEDTRGKSLSTAKLLLIGGCELLQLSSFCSSRRVEFTNVTRKGWAVRFDDSGFILGDPEKIKRDRALDRLNYWNATDVQSLADEITSSEIVITALYNTLDWNYFETTQDNLVRIERSTIKRHLKEDGMWFVSNFRMARLDLPQRLELLTRALDRLAASALPAAKHFTLGVNTRILVNSAAEAVAAWRSKLGQHATAKDMIQALGQLHNSPAHSEALRHTYNQFLKELCARRKNFVYVDVDALVDDAALVGPEPENGVYYPDHFTRRGYLAIAEFINNAAAAPSAQPARLSAAKRITETKQMVRPGGVFSAISKAFLRKSA